jgi:hypothetical protein
MVGNPSSYLSSGSGPESRFSLGALHIALLVYRRYYNGLRYTISRKVLLDEPEVVHEVACCLEESAKHQVFAARRVPRNGLNRCPCNEGSRRLLRRVARCCPALSSECVSEGALPPSCSYGTAAAMLLYL